LQEGFAVPQLCTEIGNNQIFANHLLAVPNKHKGRDWKNKDRLGSAYEVPQEVSTKPEVFKLKFFQSSILKLFILKIFDSKEACTPSGLK
jgi:hypothetical protein